jgi:hypothetical protein
MYNSVDIWLWKYFASDFLLSFAYRRLYSCKYVSISALFFCVLVYAIDVDALSLCTHTRTPNCHQIIPNTYIYILRSFFFAVITMKNACTYILGLYYSHIVECYAKSQECKPIEYKEKNRIR